MAELLRRRRRRPRALVPVDGRDARGRRALRRARARAHLRGARRSTPSGPCGGWPSGSASDGALAPPADVQLVADPANSSERVEGEGILPGRATAYRDSLDDRPSGESPSSPATATSGRPHRHEDPVRPRALRRLAARARARLLHERGHRSTSRPAGSSPAHSAQRAPGPRGRVRADHVHAASLRGPGRSLAREAALRVSTTCAISSRATGTRPSSARARRQTRRAGAAPRPRSPGSPAPARSSARCPHRTTSSAYLRRSGRTCVLVTPLVDLGSRQADWLRAAKRLGIRTGFPVFSWDNLTNKGIVRDVPDLTLVWNDIQAQEADELHGIPPERIRITGAPGRRPVVRVGPSRTPRGVLRRGRARPDAADRPLPVLVAVHRAERGRVRPALDRAPAGARAASSPRPAISSGRTRTPLAAGSAPARGAPGARLAALRRVAARRQHGGTTSTRSTTRPPSSGSTRPRRSRARSSAGRCTRCSPTSSATTQEGTLHFRYLEADEFGLLARRAHVRRARAAAGGVAPRRGRRRPQRAVPAALRPPARARALGDASWSSTRSRSSAHGPRPHRSAGRRTLRSSRWPLARLAGRGDGSPPGEGPRADARRRAAARDREARARRHAGRSQGRGPETRSASSSTGSRSCAGPRRPTSACASGCTCRVRRSTRPGTRGSVSGTEAPAAGEATRPGARAGRAPRARRARTPACGSSTACSSSRRSPAPARTKGAYGVERLPRRARRAAAPGRPAQRTPTRTTC